MALKVKVSTKNGMLVANPTNIPVTVPASGITPQILNDYINTTNNYVIRGDHTHQGNIIFENSVIIAGNSSGNSGQVLTTNGSSVYWSTVTAEAVVNTQAEYAWGNNQIFDGPMAINAEVYANDELGSAGQVLTTNGLDKVYWSTVTSGNNYIIANNSSTTARLLENRFAEVFNVKDFGAVGDGSTDDKNAINAAITACNASGGGIVYFPRGIYRILGVVVPKSNVTLMGDKGNSIIFYDTSGGGFEGISNVTTYPNFTEIENFHFKDIIVKGSGDAHNSAIGQQAVMIGNCTNITIDGCEFNYTRHMGIVITKSKHVKVTNNKVYRTHADGVAVWDCSDVIITGNSFEGCNDDSISCHTSDDAESPPRTSVLISDNIIVESQGIAVLGPKNVIITDNILQRIYGTGIRVTSPEGIDVQGQTPSFNVVIARNIVNDVFLRPEPNPRNQAAFYIYLEGGKRQLGLLPSFPGEPISGNGQVTSLYGNNTGNFYVNDTSNTDISGMHGYWWDVSDNILSRTLPSVANVSNWGYSNVGIWVGNNGDGSGFYNGEITETHLKTSAIVLEPSFRDSKISRNIFNTSGAYGIQFRNNSPSVDLDFYNLTIENNKIVNYSNAGIMTPANTTTQKILIRNNEFDADPYFTHVNRGANGTWQSAESPYGVYMQTTKGIVIDNNSFRNIAYPIAYSSNVEITGAVVKSNIIYADPSVGGFSTSNKGVGISHNNGINSWITIFEESDPSNVNYGKIKSEVEFARSNTAPNTGWYVPGHIIWNSKPGITNSVFGWIRLTTGNSHVINTDWLELKTLSGTVNSISTGNGLTGGTITTNGTISVLANTGIIANSTGLFVNATYIEAFSGNAYSNAVSYVDGKSFVNTSQLSANLANYQTSAGLAANVATLTANNSTNLNGQPASYYTNADNISSGTLPNARLSSAIVNTSGNFTISGIHTHTANISVAGIVANGSIGTSGQVLTSNGSSTYWTAAGGSGTVTEVATGNGLSGGPINTTGTVSVLANTGIVANSTGLFVNSTYIGTLTANNTSFVGSVSAANVVSNSQLSANLANYSTSALMTANDATTYSNAVSYVDGKSFVNTSQLSANLANYQTSAGLASNVATLTANNSTYLNGQPASYYTNADNIASGTLPNARLNGTVVTTTSEYTFANNLNMNAPYSFMFGNNSSNVTVNGTYVTLYDAGFYSYTSIESYAVSISSQDDSQYIYIYNQEGSLGTIEFYSNSDEIGILQFSNSTYSGYLNAVEYTGKANNTNFVGSVSAANVVSNSQLSANLANYQTSAGLASNVATLTANNTTYLNGQPASYYTNADNISSGTLPNARLSSAVVNTSGNFTVSGVHTHTANISVAGIIANSSLGTAGQILASNGSSSYWKNETGVKSITVQDPANTDNITLFYTDKSLTIESVVAVLIGNTTPNVTFSIISGSSRETETTFNVNAQSTSNVTTGQSITIANSTIAANTFVWAKITAVSGNVGQFHASIKIN